MAVDLAPRGGVSVERYAYDKAGNMTKKALLRRGHADPAKPPTLADSLGSLEKRRSACGVIIRKVLLVSLDAAIFGMILAEIYAVIMSIWPIRYITQELKEAAKSADLVLMETQGMKKG